MEQLNYINTLSKRELQEEDLKKLHWYVLFTEIGKEFIIRDEWIKIKNHINKELKILFDNLELVWTPVTEDEIDDEVIVTPYLYSYYFIAMSKPMTGNEYTAFNKMSEDLQNEIRVKVMAILNELDIRSGEVISFKKS